MTGRFLRVTWFHFYDELGRNLLVNLLWLIACFFPLPILGIPVATCALCYYARELTLFRDPPARLFWQGYTKFFWRGLGYGWGFALLAVPVAFSAIFYIVKSPDFGLWILLPAGVCLWFVVLYVLAWHYFFPFLVHQEQGFLTTVKRSCLAVLMRPGLAVTATLTWVSWLLLSMLLTPLLLFVPAIWWCISGCSALLLLIEDYDDSVPDTPLPEELKPDADYTPITSREDLKD